MIITSLYEKIEGRKMGSKKKSLPYPFGFLESNFLTIQISYSNHT